MANFPASVFSSKELIASQASLPKDTLSLPKSSSSIQKYAYESSYSTRPHSGAPSKEDIKATIFSELKNDDDLQLAALLSKGGIESLESIVRIKEAEAKMFQTKADEARRAAEGFQKMIRTKTAQMDEEYATKLSKLCLNDTEETQRRKLDEMKVVENSCVDYYKMKKKMQDEIDGLLARMEATKQHWV